MTYTLEIYYYWDNLYYIKQVELIMMINNFAI